MEVKRNGICTIDTCAETPTVPYGTTFVTHCRCVVSPTVILEPDGRRTIGARLKVSFELEWVGQVPMLKATILSSARRGMVHHFDLFTAHLEKQLKLSPVEAYQVRRRSLAPQRRPVAARRLRTSRLKSKRLVRGARACHRSLPAD